MTEPHPTSLVLGCQIAFGWFFFLQFCCILNCLKCVQLCCCWFNRKILLAKRFGPKNKLQIAFCDAELQVNNALSLIFIGILCCIETQSLLYEVVSPLIFFIMFPLCYNTDNEVFDICWWSDSQYQASFCLCWSISRHIFLWFFNTDIFPVLNFKYHLPN